MKQLKIILLGLIIGMNPIIAKAQSNIFDKYSDKPTVSSVYISKTMLAMQPNIYTSDVNIGRVAGQLESVYIVSTMDNSIKRTLQKDIDEFVKKNKYETLMKQKGITASSSFYIKKKGDKVKELVMITDGPAKLSYIHLIGDMTLKDIQRITSSQNMSYQLSYPIHDYDKIIERISNMDLSWIEETIKNSLSIEL